MVSNFGGIGPANWLFSIFLLKHDRLSTNLTENQVVIKIEKITSNPICILKALQFIMKNLINQYICYNSYETWVREVQIFQMKVL